VVPSQPTGGSAWPASIIADAGAESEHRQPERTGALIHLPDRCRRTLIQGDGGALWARNVSTMIRNVVTGRLRAVPSDEQRHADLVLLEQGLAAIAALRLPGLLSMRLGRDLGLRPGGWDFAITNDWADAESYRGYDLDQEHNRIRREYLTVVCSEIARVQFIVDD
jgi:hypothetical protein